MNALLVAFYLVILILALFIFLFHLRSLIQKKKRAGKIQAKWSSFYSFSFPLSRLVLIVLFAYFLWCVYQIISDPKSSDGYHRLLILIIHLSFTPRWNVYIGSEGILHHLKFIRWEDVREKRILVRGNKRYLEIRESLSPSFSETKIRRIPMPKNIVVRLGPKVE